jgi:hypothetical protein
MQLCYAIQSNPIQPNTMHTQVQRWVVLYIIQPLLLLECSSDTPMRTRCPLTVMKVSASHSYQTLRSSVWRHMETVMWESAGRVRGVCDGC